MRKLGGFGFVLVFCLLAYVAVACGETRVDSTDSRETSGEGGGGGTGTSAGASATGGSGGASTSGSGGAAGASGNRGGGDRSVPGSSSYWQFGTPSGDSGFAVAVDASGNVYVAGSTNGDLGGPNAGLSDGFARKYDPFGTPLWTQQFGTSSGDRISASAADASGNLYVVGETDGALDGTSVRGP